MTTPMTFEALNLGIALPEIVLLSAVSLLVVLDVFLDDSKRGITHVLSVLILLATAAIVWFNPHENPLYGMHGMYVADAVGDVLKLGILLTTAWLMAYTRPYLKANGLFTGEFHSLTLLAVLGMMVMVSGSHLLSLYLGLELMSLSLYAIVALRRDDTASTEAAMKYFILGALASGMLLYGISMVYGGTGQLGVAEIAQVIKQGSASPNLVLLGLVFVVAGLAFKLGAAPFHMWVPDVYHGAPTAMTVLLGSAPKIAAYAMVFRILVQALGAEMIAPQWQMMLVILGVASIAVGNIAAIAQQNLKRMLAYSAIAHMGWVVLGFAAGSAAGYAGALYYVLMYAIMTLGGFGLILLLSRVGFESDRLEDLKGLNRRSPWFALVMLLVMVSMAGIPITVGFFAKVAVLQAVVAADMMTVAVIAVLLSLLGAFYYLRVIKLMYFDEPEDSEPLSGHAPEVSVLLSVNGIAIVALAVVPQGLIAACHQAVRASLGL